MQVEIIGKDLDYHFHQVLLRNDVFAVDHLLQDTGQDELAVCIEIDPFELGQADEVGADQDAQVFALNFALLAIPRVARVLQSDPELVHFDKVGEDEADRV
jgi:hypothetical protein